MKFVGTVLIVLIAIFSVLAVFVSLEQQTRIPNAEAVVEYAQKNLEHTGVLKEGRGGYVYLKVSDQYIHELFSILANPQYREPDYFRRPHSTGAHISVFYVDEKVGHIDEIGQTFSFEIDALQSVHRYIVLNVTSPQLEQLRQKYGKKPLLKGHPFHITLAEKKRTQ